MAEESNLLHLVIVFVEGMKCNGCTNKVQSALQSISKVTSVELVDLQTRMAVFWTVGNMELKTVEEAVSSTGKSVISFCQLPIQVGEQDSFHSAVFLLKLEPLRCTSCIRGIETALKDLNASIISYQIDNKLVVVKVPVEVGASRLSSFLQTRTKREVQQIVALSVPSFDSSFIQKEDDNVLEDTPDRQTVVKSQFVYIFKLRESISQKYIEKILGSLKDCLDEENVVLLELNSRRTMLYLILCSEIEIATVKEVFAYFGCDVEWSFGSSFGKTPDEYTKEPRSKHQMFITINPPICCSFCAVSVTSMIESSIESGRAKWIDKDPFVCLSVEMSSILDFDIIEKVMQMYVRSWQPHESLEQVLKESNRSFLTGTNLQSDASYINKPSEHVRHINLTDLLNIYHIPQSFQRRLLSVPGIMLIQQDGGSFCSLFFDSNITDETVLLPILQNFISSRQLLVENPDRFETVIFDGSQQSNETLLDSNVCGNEDTGLVYLKRFSCGCKKPLCCCLSLPVSDDEMNEECWNIILDTSKDGTRSPRGVEELVTFLSCSTCCQGSNGDINELNRTSLIQDEQKLHQQSCPIFSGASTEKSSNKGLDSFREGEKKASKAIMHIAGMSCTSCVGAIEDCLKRYRGVVNITVGLISGTAKVDFVPDIISVEEIKQAVESLGYNITSARLDDQSSSEEMEERILNLKMDNREMAEEISRFLQKQPEVESVSTTDLTSRRKGKSYIAKMLFDYFHFSKHKDADFLISVAIKEQSLQDWKRNALNERHSEDVDWNPKIRLAKRLEEQDLMPTEFLPSDFDVNADENQLSIKEKLSLEADNWLFRVVFSALFTIPCMIFSFGLSHHVASVDKYLGNSRITIAQLVEWILASFVQFLCGYPFYRGSYYAIFRAHRPNMDVLIALATSVIYIYSVAFLIYNSVAQTETNNIDFDSSSMLITIVSIGKWLEALAKRDSSRSVSSLNNLEPRNVKVVSSVSDDSVETVDSELLLVGDTVKVLPGERFPVDGIVESGDGDVDESAITGESLPVRKHPNDKVLSGTMNGNSLLYVKATAVGSQRTLSQIVRLVEDAQISHAPIESLADKISAYFVLVIIVIGLIVFLVWILITEERAVSSSWYDSRSPVTFSLIFAVSVVAVACPCALGLATPTVLMVASSVAARFGLLFKESSAIQHVSNAASVIFDKTGTLTKGQPKVMEVCLLNETQVPLKELVRLVSHVESNSEHPLARAIVRYAQEEQGLSISSDVQSLEQVPGCGVKALIPGLKQYLLVGSMQWIFSECKTFKSGNEDTVISEEDKRILSDWTKDGKSIVMVAIDYLPCIAFGIEDEIRPESAQVISYLKKNFGIECWLATGDNEATANAVAKIVGIAPERVIAQALPTDKVKAVESLQERYRSNGKKSKKVLFVGDGINDAPALAAADVGISIGSKNHIAADAAKASVMNDNIHGLIIIFHLSRAAFRRVLLNYLWAVVYNILFIPGAAGVLYPVIRKQMPPWFAAILMASSSVTVTISSILLRFYRPPKVAVL
eukprot:jgi/Galph1/3054/GphlegSOOS_G1708.1